MTYTRVREHGTVETMPNTPADRMQAVNNIVESRSYAKVDGCGLDLTSAHAIVTVYNALNDQNKLKFASMPVHKMTKIAFQLIK